MDTIILDSRDPWSVAAIYLPQVLKTNNLDKIVRKRNWFEVKLLSMAPVIRPVSCCSRPAKQKYDSSELEKKEKQIANKRFYDCGPQ